MSEVIKNRYEFVMLFDVENGNPNGDPDAGNMPRIDYETGHGIVTDVCLKRKIRNYVETTRDNEAGYSMYIKQGRSLQTADKEAFTALEIDPDKMKDKKKDKSKESENNVDADIMNFMCKTFFDIRTFGAVMTTFVKHNLNCGQVRGPVQLSFAKSIDPIPTQEITLTRMAITKEDEVNDKKTEMGHKYVVPYALYRAEGFVSANLAQKTTKFTEDDLDLLWESIINMFEHDRSAARSKMVMRELIVFKHECINGNVPSHKLFELVKVNRIDGVTSPRKYSDYSVEVIDNSPLLEKVTLNRMI